MDISLYRGNANKIVSKAIIDGMIDCGVKMADFTGGSLRNAIPFEAAAVILVPEDKEEEVLAMIIKSLSNSKKCYAQSDPDMEYVCEHCDKPAGYIEDQVAVNALKAIIACHPESSV